MLKNSSTSKENITKPFGNATTFSSLAREAQNALIIINKCGLNARTVELLTFLLFSFFENCFWLAPQAHDQVRAEVVNFLYKARGREKLTKTFIARRLRKILQNLILAGYALPRKEYPAGLLSEHESLDKILSEFSLQNEDLEIQDEVKTSRRSGIRHKAQLRDFSIRRGIENRKPSSLKQQDLFCLKEAA